MCLKIFQQGSSRDKTGLYSIAMPLLSLYTFQHHCHLSKWQFLTFTFLQDRIDEMDRLADASKSFNMTIWFGHHPFSVTTTPYVRKILRWVTRQHIIHLYVSLPCRCSLGLSCNLKVDCVTSYLTPSPCSLKTTMWRGFPVPCYYYYYYYYYYYCYYCSNDERFWETF